MSKKKISSSEKVKNAEKSDGNPKIKKLSNIQHNIRQIKNFFSQSSIKENILKLRIFFIILRIFYFFIKFYLK